MGEVYDNELELEKHEEYYIVNENDEIIDGVVFCRECRHYGTNGTPSDWCSVNKASFPEHGYCCYGDYRTEA